MTVASRCGVACALPSDQFQSQLRHFKCPNGEVGNDQPRLRAFHVQTICSQAARVLKELPRPPYKAEWPVLQLPKLPKTQERPSRKVRSRPKGVGFDSSLHSTPGVSPIAGAVIAKSWRALFSHRRLCVQMPWAVLEETCLSCRCRLFRPLAEGQDSAGRSSPRGSPNCQNCLQRLQPVGVMKMSSSVGASRRLPEFTLLCADPTVASTGTSAAHAPNVAFPVSVCLPAPTQQVSNQRLLDLGLAVGSTNSDVPFHSQFFDLFGSEPLPTRWE